MSYWKSSMQEVLERSGIVFTDAQLEQISKDTEMVSQMAFEATGQEFIPNPIQEENKRLLRAIEVEKSKVVCFECLGIGSKVSNFGPIGRSSIERCDKCSGEGKITL